MNVYNKNGNSVNAGAFSEGTNYFRGSSNNFNRFGGNVDWQNQKGFGASVNYQRVPQFNMHTFGANGNVNLYNRNNLKIDGYGGASRNFGPNSNRRTDWNVGVRGVWRFK
ncbi:attacin-A-like [Chironomus tepperi]|uniref:attacin-A-like n=1 Tax=Chironomus tepperi TaxID=113505 RepID=UPI00391F14D4